MDDFAQKVANHTMDTIFIHATSEGDIRGAVKDIVWHHLTSMPETDLKRILQFQWIEFKKTKSRQKRQFAKIERRPEPELRDYQLAPANAYIKYTQDPITYPKGLLVYFEVGTGKTFAALNTAVKFMKDNPDGHVYVITTRSNVKTTWEESWKCYNAPEFHKRFSVGTHEHVFGLLDVRMVQSAGEIKATMTKPKHNYMIIVDECHTVRKSDTNTYMKLKPVCFNAHYVMLMTATPIVGNNDDARSLIRLITDGSKYKHANIDLEDDDCIAKMVHMFMYKKQHDEFASIRTFTKEVQLGEDYNIWASSVIMNDSELCKTALEARGKEWAKRMQRGLQKGHKDPFLVNSRMYANGPQKMSSIWAKLCTNNFNASLVYSNFVTEGTEAFIKWILANAGGVIDKKTFKMVRVKDNDITREIVLWDERHSKAITEWQSQHNHIKKILLVSPKGREGLSLMRVRSVHLMDPSWHVTDEEQVIGRASRLLSHADLPQDQRNIRVYRWKAVSEGHITSDQIVSDTAKERRSDTAGWIQALQVFGASNLSMRM